jgi:hypothetical protein
MPDHYGRSLAGQRRPLNGQMSSIAPRNSGVSMPNPIGTTGAFLPGGGQNMIYGGGQRPTGPRSFGMPAQSQMGISNAYGRIPSQAQRAAPFANFNAIDPDNGDILEAIVKNWNRRNQQIDQDNKKMQAASPLAMPRPKLGLMETFFKGTGNPAAQWFRQG